MARKLRFHLNDQDYEFVIEKLDRDKLYGKKEVIPKNVEGLTLRKGYLDEWGSVVISSTGMGYVDRDKNWRGKNELVAVDAMGNHLEMKPSSFDEPIALTNIASLEEFCEYEMASVYLMKGFEESDFLELLLGIDGLYCFPFVYRAGYEAKAAFLNVSGENLFMCIGTRAELGFLDKPQRVDLEVEEEDDDDFDFAMM